MKAPGFWWRDPSLLSRFLAPASYIYAQGASRAFGRGAQANTPVLCIGNFVVGGAGKTPVALALATRFQVCGREVVFLSRGYGGAFRGPHLVSASRDRAINVGDEPLLLAKQAPTIISRDRVAGLRFIERNLTPDLIIMDDGFQSARIKPDCALLVVDGEVGVGNGRVIPAGPLRAPLPLQCAHSDALLVVQGKGENHQTTRQLIDDFQNKNAPVFFACLTPKAGKELDGQRVVAFSGIGRPQKFFDTVASMGCDLVSHKAFPDHHPFSERDAAELLEQALLFDAKIVTTAKDAVRLHAHDGNQGRLFEALAILEVEMTFEREPDLASLIKIRR